VVETALNFANIAPGNYETVTLTGGQIFDGLSYAAGTTTAQQFTNDTSSINPSGNGFGVANNLVNDNEGFLFSNPKSASLTFDVNFQPNTNSVTITYATYNGATPTGASVPVQTGTLVVNRDADGIVTTTIDPTIDFDHIVVRFDYSGGGNPAARVENFSVGQQVIPDNQVLSFGVTVTDADGDIVSSSTAATTIDLTFLGGAPIPPIALDLDGNGLEFLALSAGVSHQYIGSEQVVSTAWVAPTDGLLAHLVDGKLDIVFSDDAAGAKTDLQGLALAYDSNGDGQFSAADAAYGSFGVWQDANSNGVADAGEYRSLDTAGIVSLNLTGEGGGYSAANGDVQIVSETSFLRADGSTGAAADVTFVTAGPALRTAAQDQPGATGFNQALVAAGLVGAIGLIAPEAEKPMADATPITTAIHTDDIAQAAGLSINPQVDDAASAPKQGDPLDDQTSPSAPVSHDFEEAPVAGLSDDTPPASTGDQGWSGDPVDAPGFAPLPVAAADIALPAFASEAALLAVANMQVEGKQLGTVLADALAGGGNDGPDIDALLDTLPTGQSANDGGQQFAGPTDGGGDLGHMAAAAGIAGAFHFDLAVMSHDAVAGTVHA
jgi:hypothetical protein